MDPDRADLSDVPQASELPGLSTIGSPVHALARGDVAAHAVRACSVVDDVRIGVRHGDRAARAERHLAVRDRDPRLAAVRRPEQAAARDAHIERPRLRRNARDRRDAPALRRPHLPELEALENHGVHGFHHRPMGRRSLGLSGNRSEGQESEKGEQLWAFHESHPGVGEGRDPDDKSAIRRRKEGGGD